MSLTEGFNFFKQKSGLRVNELTDIDKDNLKKFRDEWGGFTDAIADRFNFISTQNGRGLWNTSGTVSKYMWNRYKPVNDNTNLVVFFTVSIDDGFFISVGLVDNKLTDEEQAISSEVYKYFNEQLKGKACSGFDNSKIDNERKYIFNPDSLEEIKFDCVLNNLISVYNSAINKFYSDSIVKSEDTNPSNPSDNTMIMQHNTILFGPPGTGKTYNTINHALLALHEDVSMLTRDQQLEKFNEYVSKGQIVFTTFHQSYGYEEFIEGIKPDMESDDGEVRYEVKDGVFKELCNRALGVKTFKSGKDEIEIKSDATVWKVSLGSSGNNPIKTKCFVEGTIRIGWTSVKEVGDEYYIKLGSKNKNTIRNFIDEMKIGDIVVSIGNQKNADAIGVIVGDYQTDNDPNYPKFRNVKWYFTGRNVSIYDLNERKNLVQKTVYKLHSISVEKVISLLKEQGVFNTPTSPEDYESKINYVIIIDEINRGNISKIFGELITLIEPSKRIGAPEELRVTLPYSGNEFDGGKGFGVPSNVYIVGTMNTADRSIALMDTALRRRFEFIEMMPKPELLQTIVIKDADEQRKEHTLDLKKLLEVINSRISYLYDRDHQIGHAYFMSLLDDKVKDKKAELDNIFRNKIIPLLQEYFYDDWEKIQIVLGDHEKQKPDNKDRFILSEKQKEIDVLGFNHDDIVDETISYTISEKFTTNAYLKITVALDPKPTLAPTIAPVVQDNASS